MRFFLRIKINFKCSALYTDIFYGVKYWVILNYNERVAQLVYHLSIDVLKVPSDKIWVPLFLQNLLLKFVLRHRIISPPKMCPLFDLIFLFQLFCYMFGFNLFFKVCICAQSVLMLCQPDFSTSSNMFTCVFLMSFRAQLISKLIFLHSRRN